MRARQQQKEEVYRMDKIIKIGFALMALLMAVGAICDGNENDRATYGKMSVFYALGTVAMVVM